MAQIANSILYKLEHLQNELDMLILATPTGEQRNALTDVNIVLLMAIGALRSTGRVHE